MKIVSVASKSHEIVAVSSDKGEKNSFWASWRIMTLNKCDIKYELVKQAFVARLIYR